MKYALIATVEQPLTYWVEAVGGILDPDYVAGHYTEIMAEPGTIVNIIVYDGIAEYTPPEGSRLAEVPDDAKIGDTGF
jgi:hypothetical protein